MRKILNKFIITMQNLALFYLFCFVLFSFNITYFSNSKNNTKKKHQNGRRKKRNTSQVATKVNKNVDVNDLAIVEPKSLPAANKRLIKKYVFLSKKDGGKHNSTEPFVSSLKIDLRKEGDIPINVKKKKKESKPYLKVSNLPSMAYYIYWPSAEELNPFFIAMTKYMITIAIKRGYNYFALQRIHIKDTLKNQISDKNLQFLEEQAFNIISEQISKNPIKDKVIFLSEAVFNEINQEIFEKHGGFFLICKYESKNNLINVKMESKA